MMHSSPMNVSPGFSGGNPDRRARRRHFRSGGQARHSTRLWVMMALIFCVACWRSPSREPASPITPIPTIGGARSVGFVIASTLNLRQGPGRTYSIIDQLSRGQELEIVNRQSDLQGNPWLQVNIPRTRGRSRGWVAEQFVDGKRPSLIHGNYVHLDYQPVSRPNYPGNPRRGNIKGVYVSIYSAASARWQELLDLATSTDINALVIDVKDDRGQMLFKTRAAEKHNPPANEAATLRDIEGFLQQTRQAGIYTIARIVVFKDPLFAQNHRDQAVIHAGNGKLFKSQDGMPWASPRDAGFRQYNLAVAQEAAAAGFNEIQFDYVRFPVEYSQVKLHYPGTHRGTKAGVIQDFLLEARRQLQGREVYLSADVFGLVCTAQDDMNIGQYWEAMSNVVDFICPMMYPSHYANQSYGLSVPDKDPYELMNRAVRDAHRRNRNIPTPADIRPWIQGFTASWLKEHRNYGPAEVKAQIRALKENGIESYLVWSPSNRYATAAYR